MNAAHQLTTIGSLVCIAGVVIGMCGLATGTPAATMLGGIGFITGFLLAAAGRMGDVQK